MLLGVAIFLLSFLPTGTFYIINRLNNTVYSHKKKCFGSDTDTETYWTLVLVPGSETWFGLYTRFAIDKPSKMGSHIDSIEKIVLFSVGLACLKYMAAPLDWEECHVVFMK